MILYDEILKKKKNEKSILAQLLAKFVVKILDFLENLLCQRKFTLHTNLYFYFFFLKYRLNFSKISIKKYFKHFFSHIWRYFEKRKKWKTSFFEDFTQNEVAEIQDFVKIWCFLRIYITYKPRFHFSIFKISTQFFKNKHLKVF